MKCKNTTDLSFLGIFGLLIHIFGMTKGRIGQLEHELTNTCGDLKFFALVGSLWGISYDDCFGYEEILLNSLAGFAHQDISTASILASILTKRGGLSIEA